MPWTIADVARHKLGLTPKQKRQWVEVANSVLARCLADGGEQTVCEARAVRQANGVAGGKMEPEVIEIGASVKMAADGRFSGYLVRFTDEDHPDLEGEYFTKDTDFGLESGQKSAVYFHHGQDAVLGKRVLGKAAMMKDDVGVWIEGQLALRDKWERAIRQMGMAGKLNWSSGTAGHLVEREDRGKATWIKRWPLGLDASMTPTPAEPGAILSMKSYSGLQALELKGFLPEDAPEQGDGGGDASDKQPSKSEQRPDTQKQGSTMTKRLKMFPAGSKYHVYEVDEQEKPLGFPLKSFDKQVEAEEFISEETMPEELKMMRTLIASQQKGMESLIARLDNQVVNAQKGMRISGKAFDTEKGQLFGKFVLAIMNRDQQTLENMGASMKITEATGPGGAYLVPTELLPDFFMLGGENEIVYPRADVQPVDGPVALPGLSTAGSTAGRSNFYGGMYAEWTRSGQKKPEQDIEFTRIELNPWELAGWVPVEDQLLRRSARNIPNLLTSLFREATSFYRDEAFLDGTGAGQPLGIINAPGTFVQARQTAGTITYLDLVRMKGHLLPTSWMNAHWVFQISDYETLRTLQDPSGRYIWVENARDGEPPTVLGLPYRFTEKTPILGTRGDVLLADERYYYIADEVRLQIAMSEHVRFLENQTVFKFFLTVDGQPKLHAPIYLKDGQTQVSPFVVLGGAQTT